MKTDPTKNDNSNVRNRGENGAHDSGADYTGTHRDAEKSPDTPRPGEGSTPGGKTADVKPEEELGIPDPGALTK